MSPGADPEEPSSEVLATVASAAGADVTLLSRLPGGINAGAMHVQLAGRASAVLKVEPRAQPKQLDETLRAQRVVEHMRGRGYPTPAWLEMLFSRIDPVPRGWVRFGDASEFPGIQAEHPETADD